MYQYEYKTLHDMVSQAAKNNIALWEVAMRHEMETSEQTEQYVRRMMSSRLDVFHESIKAGLEDKEKSVSGLVGGDADKLLGAKAKLLDNLAHKTAVYALAISEANAKMFKIVACPTAGSCGILPAVMIAVAEELGTDTDASINALFMAAGIGAVVSRNASVAGAVGGCQAECGTAAAMAAAAAVELAGGTNDEIVQGFALCMKNTLGLACDPVAGLVEVPCVKRNACLAVMAIAAAEMALAGIKSVIPPDEVIEAMASIGHMMPVALKETSEGGLARTVTGKEIAERLEKSMQDE